MTFTTRRFLSAIFVALVLQLFATSSKAESRPNIILILADDLGFSDIAPYGGEIRTPNLEKLAKNGLRYSQFYNGARCCPSRASLMTGLYPHQAHVGDMVDEYARRIREKMNSPAYSDRLNPLTPTIAEALKASGYRTFMSGKWHLGYRTNEWPFARGFDRSFAVIEGAMNYYGFGIQHTGIVTNPPMALDDKVFLPPRDGFFATDAFTDFAVRCIEEEKKNSAPFFLYLAYTAPHWPLHAKPENVAKYRGKYKKIGWDKLREQRHERLIKAGIIDKNWPLVPRPANVGPWDKATPEQKERWDEEMSIYAAQTTEMDLGIGEVLKALKKTGRDKNTLIFFLSDNGGAAEDPNRSLPGAKLNSRESYEGYGINGAHLSSGPFRKTKKYSHEGGISTPLIINWPKGISKEQNGKVLSGMGHIIDIMPTCLEAAGATFPNNLRGETTLTLEGISLKSTFVGQPIPRSAPLFWEHEGHRAVRDGKWKLVATFNEPWELYDMEADRMELNDLFKMKPEIARDLLAKYEGWADRIGVKPWPMPENRPPAEK